MAVENHDTQSHHQNLAERLRAVLDTVADGILTVDEYGVIETVNPAAERIFGYAGPEMIGRNVSMLMPAEYAEHHAGYIADFVREKRSNILGMKRELRGLRKDGTMFPLEIAIGLAMVDGRRLFTGILRDISRLKARDEALRMSEERMRATVYSALDCIIIIDKVGRVVEFNPAAEACFGYRREDAVGQPLSSLIIPHRHRSAHYQGMNHYNATGEGPILGKRIEVEAMRSDGSEFMVELAVEAVSHEDGSLFIAYLRDITARREQEQAIQLAKTRAEEANKAKAGFLAMMSHEIRTPLNGVLGVLGLLEDTGLDHTQQHYVATARQSGEGLLDIISDILDYSKMEAGKLEFERFAFELRPVVQSVVEILRTKAANQNTRLEFQVAGNVPAVILGDPGRLRQVILNLASNAVKFTRNGQVHISVAQVQDGAQMPGLLFSVMDTGIGIAPEQQEKLFTEFTTLDPSYSRKFGGTGLGLAITQKLVHIMNGTIDFESQENQGSTFRFTIPCETGPVSLLGDNIRNDGGEASAEPQRKLRILLTEDNPTNRMVARSMLDKAGHHVDTAANGSEAVDAVLSRPYDVVLMDVSMPVMDGLQATRAIRNLSGAAAKIPIIAMTAHAMVGDREDFLAAGMDDYLAKPVGRTALMDALARWTSPETQPTEEADVPAFPDNDQPLFDPAVLDELARETDASMIPIFIKSFFTDIPQRMQRIDAAVPERDLDVLQREAHTIGSSAATFGAMALHKHARQIEGLCLDQDFPAAAALVPELRHWVEKTFEVLRVHNNTLET